MFQKLWQWLKKLWQKWFPQRRATPGDYFQPKAPLNPTECEAVFLELLNQVDRGSNRLDIQAFLIIQQMQKRITEANLVEWLQSSGHRWLESPSQHRELGRRMVQLGEIYRGELAQVAGDLGRQLLTPKDAAPSSLETEETTTNPGEDIYDLPEVAKLKPWFVNPPQPLTLKPEDSEGLKTDNNQTVNLSSKPSENLSNTIDSAAEALLNQGLAQVKLGRYQEAIDDYTQAIALNSDFYQAYYNRGVAQGNLGQYQEAIEDYTQAIALNSDYYDAYNNRGIAQYNLGQYQEAIEDYTQAIALNSDYYDAYNNRGIAQYDLGRYQEAIDDFTQAIALKSDYWQAWDGRGLAILSLHGYDPAIKNWRDGIAELEKHSPVDLQGCGELYWQIGDEQSRYGNRQANPFPHWRAAKNSYYKSLENLNQTRFSERYLEVLKNYIQTCRALGENQPEIDELIRQGTDRLARLVSNCNLPADKLRLERKFASFIQYRVDSLVAKNQISAALNLAEERRNTSLRWLPQSSHDSPDFNSLLNHPQTVAIYWHVSDAAITTFILKFAQSPTVLPTTATSIDAYKQLQKFETWIEKWKQDYQDSRKEKPEATTPKTSLEIPPWRQEMIPQLEELKTILDIPSLLPQLANIRQLILIPHRDLHLLPLNYLFSQTDFTITYLPSIQIGIELQQLPNPATNQLLSIETPSRLLFAEIESGAIAQLYHPHLTTIPSHAATKEQVTAAISADTNCLHFTGHGYHNLDVPTESALELQGKELLTLAEIFELNFQGYQLVCLSACETGITSKQGLIDEYVGLVSGFLAVGVAHVVSTLWTVDEISAALIMIKFHQLFQTGIPPAVALKEAQKWLRTITHRQLAQWYRERAATVAPFNRPCSRDLEDEATLIENNPTKMETIEPPYAHPYYWAGFIITGKNHPLSVPN